MVNLKYCILCKAELTISKGQLICLQCRDDLFRAFPDMGERFDTNRKLDGRDVY